MNTDRPVVLIYSGRQEIDEFLRDGLLESFPNLGLRTARGIEELRRNIGEMEVLVSWGFPYELLADASNLRWIQMLGAGVDSLAGVKLPSGLTVTNVRGIFGPSMAEHAMAYLLAHVKELRRFWRLQNERLWKLNVPRMLRGSTVGIAGLGSIGRTVAEYCHAFGMDVIGLTRSGAQVPGVRRVYRLDEIGDFLPLCDFLVLVMPATRETSMLLTRERLELLKRGCFLVNIGRGNVMDEDDLINALRSGRLGGAALDVFADEPLAESSPLWGMENVHITPHVAGINRPHDLLPPVRENVRRYIRGEVLANVVDLDRGY